MKLNGKQSDLMVLEDRRNDNYWYYTTHAIAEMPFRRANASCAEIK